MPGRCSRGTGGRCGHPSRTVCPRSTSTSGRGAWRSTTPLGQSCWPSRTTTWSGGWRRATDVANLPARARVVVVGGGVGGSSVAYHLAARGESDVLLLERAEL